MTRVCVKGAAMDEKEIKLKMKEYLSEEQSEQLSEALEYAARRNSCRKGRNMSNSQARKIGIVITAISAAALLFTFYLFFLGGSADGVCIKANRVSGKYYNTFAYTVDGKEYQATISCNKNNKIRYGDSYTIHYMPGAPSVVFDYNLLILAHISGGIGIVFIIAGRNGSDGLKEE